MPELPEAETIARQLQARLAGRTLGDIVLSRPDVVKTTGTDLAAFLPGKRILRVYRRAKRVVVELDSLRTLVFGLGMTGQLTVVASDAEVEKHTHLRIHVPSLGAELRFRDARRFGGVWIFDRQLRSLDANSSEGMPGGFGVEPLTCSPSRFRETLRRKRQIKALLMDQRVIAGLGNIYCDESLHAARIHPLQRASSLTPAENDALLRSIKTVLRRAIRSRGSTLMDYRGADGVEGGFQRLHRVYGREGEPCKTCGAAIRRIQAAGRSTHFCPKCQKQKRNTKNRRSARTSC